MLPLPIFGKLLRRGLGQSHGGDGVTYLLYDKFITDRAAGAVNGTPAEPTGQTRTVVDTNSKLSIAGGVASFATGGVGAGDQGLWYPAITTALGTILLAQVTVAAGGSAQVGFDTAAAGAIQHAIGFTGNFIRISSNAASTNPVGTYTDATAYTIIVLQRAVGDFFFIKGGSEYPKITLIYVSAAGAAGSLFPGATGLNTTTIYTLDNIRIPIATYIPQPLAYDTFTRANGALGSTETAGPDGQLLSAIAWAFTVGIWTVVTNKAVGTPTPGADVIVNGAFAADTNWSKGAGWAIAAGTANATAASSDLTASVAPLTVGLWYQLTFTVSGFSAGTIQGVLGTQELLTRAANGTFVQTRRANTTAFVMRGVGFTGSIDNVICKAFTTAELFASVAVSTADVIADVAITLAATVGEIAGLVLNLDSTSNPQNYIVVYTDGIQLYAEEFVAGVGANKTTAGITYSAGAILRVVREGTQCRLFYNNAAVGTLLTMTANTNTKHGLFSTSANNSFDNFTLFPRGTSSEYAGLDAF